MGKKPAFDDFFPPDGDMFKYWFTSSLSSLLVISFGYPVSRANVISARLVVLNSPFENPRTYFQKHGCDERGVFKFCNMHEVSVPPK